MAKGVLSMFKMNLVERLLARFDAVARLFAFLATIALLAGCGAGDLIRIPVQMPNGEKVTIVAHNQKVPDWMLSKNKLALNYIVKGDVTDTQLGAVNSVQNAGRLYVKKARPNDLVSIISNGICYAAAGYVGVGLGSMAFPGAIPHQYAVYGAAATGLSGLVNGLITRGGQTYTFEEFGRETFGLFPRYGITVLMKSPY